MTSAATRPLTDLDVVRAALDAEYDVLAELGRGGMATVYRARERGLDRDVALKVLPFALTHDADFVARFEREAKTAASLEHPHIIPIYRVGRAGQVTYFAMKLLRGQSLSDRLAACGRLSVADVRRVLIETAGALGYAARRGVVHRDVKPDNIMLEEDGRCVVTDFGIARSASDAKLTATGMSIGTPRYMSPEQARAKDVDGRSDLYSLGVVAYECLTGRPPFEGEDAVAILMDHVSAPVPRPRLATSEEWALYAVIERLLAKQPGDRFQSGDELVAALVSLTSATGAGPAYPGATEIAGAVSHAASPDGHYGGESNGPRPSAALDRALDAGLDLLKQQRPKLEAGLDLLKQQKPKLDAGLQAIRAQRPRLDAGLAAGKTLVAEQEPRVREAAGRAARTLERARAYAAANPRLWHRVVAGAVLSVAAFYGAHFATKHRSRCPQAVVADSLAPQAVSLLVDAIGTVRQGSDLDVYYDVCGARKGDPLSVRITAVRHESGLRRLIGDGVDPVAVSLDETAGGPRTRRHETLDFDAMPAGSYTLAVDVSDAAGRHRGRAVDFQVRSR